MTEIVISRDGTLQFIWDDSLADLLDHGAGTVRRASFVEPTPGGQWMCDIIGGPRLGPFRLRGIALAVERDFLRARMK